MPDHQKPGVLRNLKINRVALVDAGANFDKATKDGAHIMLFKSDSMGALHVDSTEWETDYEKANLDADSRNKLPDSAFAAVWTDTSGKKQRKLPIHDAGHLAAARGRIDQADIPASVKAEARRKIDSVTPGSHKEKNVKKSIIKRLFEAFRETDVTKQAAAIEEIEKEFPPEDDDSKTVHKAGDAMCKCADCVAMRKSASDAVAKKAADDAAAELSKNQIDVAKRVVDLEKANKDLVANLASEVEKRLDGEMETVLKAFKHTPVDLKTDVAIFRKMKAENPAMFERTIAIMKGTDAQLSESALYKNIGAGGDLAVDSPWAQLEAKADALIEKGTGNMTKEQALEKVMLDPKNRGLVKAYRNQATQ